MTVAWILRYLVERAARDKLRGLLRQQAESILENPHAQTRPSVIFTHALGMEAGGLVDHMTNPFTAKGQGFIWRQGRWLDYQIGLVQTGVGRQATQQALAKVLSGQRPEWVICIGFAGGLQTQVARGAIVLSNKVLAAGQTPLAIDLSIAESPADSHHQGGWHLGTTLTVDDVITSAAEKQRLGQESGALAVDMESYWVAQACQEHKTRCLVVRAVTDAVDDELPPEIQKLLRQKTWARQAGAAVGALVQRPSHVKELWQLKEQALVAADRLAAFLKGLLPQLNLPIAPQAGAASGEEPA